MSALLRKNEYIYFFSIDTCKAVFSDCWKPQVMVKNIHGHQILKNVTGTVSDNYFETMAHRNGRKYLTLNNYKFYLYF